MEIGPKIQYSGAYDYFLYYKRCLFFHILFFSYDIQYNPGQNIVHKFMELNIINKST